MHVEAIPAFGYSAMTLFVVKNAISASQAGVTTTTTEAAKLGVFSAHYFWHKRSGLVHVANEGTIKSSGEVHIPTETAVQRPPITASV